MSRLPIVAVLLPLVGLAAAVPAAGPEVRRLPVPPAAGGGVEALVELGWRPVAWLAPDAVLALREVPDGAGPPQRRARRVVAPGLAEALEQVAEGGGDVPVVVAAAGVAAADRVAAAVAAAGGEVLWRREAAGLVQLGSRIPGAGIAALVASVSDDPAVTWIDRQPGARLHNGDSAWRCQSGEPSVTPLFDHGLDGAGQVIAVLDTGLDADHCAFRDELHGPPAVNLGSGTAVSPGHRKLQAVDFLWDEDLPPGPGRWDDHGHGTHVAGSAAGDVSGDGLHQGFDGMAPAARLVIQDAGLRIDDCGDLPALGCPMVPLEPFLEQAYAQGARIHNLSWGDAENARPLGRYTERTADVDRYLRRHPDAVVLVAAGNAGAEGDATVGSPATGKNVIAVGAATPGAVEPPCPAFFSARGWTRDGRIKPDLLAPGASVVSAASDGWVESFNCDDRQLSGTSMASPTAAGLAALVRQYFLDGYHPGGLPAAGKGFEPSGALVKAVLLASAVDLSPRCPGVAPVPSRGQGWGLVRLGDALPLPGDRRRLVVADRRDRFGAGDRTADELVVVTGGGPLKVVLTWYDEPSSSLAAANLVNDLDLEVVGPEGVLLGNVLSGGRSVAGGAADRRDTVEVVHLPDAAAGRWTVRVVPHRVPAAPQGYALVVVGDLADRSPRRPGGRVGAGP